MNRNKMICWFSWQCFQPKYDIVFIPFLIQQKGGVLLVFKSNNHNRQQRGQDQTRRTLQKISWLNATHSHTDIKG